MAGLIPFNRKKQNLPAVTGFEDFYNMLDDFFSDSWPLHRSLMRDTFKLDVQENEKEKKNFVHRERRYCSMSRSVYLADAKNEDISAKLENGLLRVTVPKLQKPDNRRRIEIQ